MSTVPTKTGWYRARWKNEGRESPRRDTYDRDVRETDSGCVFVTQWGTELAVAMLGGSVRRLDQFEWGESIDAVFAERDRLATEVAALRAELEMARAVVGGDLPEHEARVRGEERDACITVIADVMGTDYGRGAERALRKAAELMRARAADHRGPTT